MRAHARIELAVLILGKLCATEARQYTIANTGVIDLLIPLLMRGYPRLQIATLRALSAMSYENMEICSALASMSHRSKSFPSIVLDLARSHDPEIRLSACLCLSNLSRMRVHAGPQKEIQTVAVPALVKLMHSGDMDQLQVIQALGYLCHEDLDIQAAAKNAGAITELTRILAEIEGQENADFVDQERNVKVAKIVFLTLGTIVSTDEECRKKAVDSNVLWHLVKAMGHRDAGVRAAACLCARYIVRSVSICRTHLPESGILKPLLRLLSDDSEDVQVTASATLVNMLTELSPMKPEALKEGVVDILLRLIDSENVTIRRNALWSIMNILSGVDDDTKKDVMGKVKVDRVCRLAADDSEPVIQAHAVGVLRNSVNECMWGISALFDTLGSTRVLELLRQLLQSDYEPVIVHALYIINNTSIMSQPHCDLLVHDKALMQSVVKYVSSGSTDITIGALWCINSIAEHKAPSQETDTDADGTGHPPEPRYVSVLNELGVQPILERMAQDPSCGLEVRDRVKTCLDYFV
ncbi:ARM repeat-containing protein [Martensiomyces pterosporus]|nr:ARM repeat-containing protein [Martensiomyces pterosporus]